MKSLKLILIFAVLVFAITGSMLITGTVDSAQAVDYAGKAVALVVIVGIAMLLMVKVAPSRKTSSQSETSTKPGPKF